MGFEDGETPPGFEIPCGRGRSTEDLRYVTNLITLFLPPIVVGISLLLIHRSVVIRERRLARSGAGSLINGAAAAGSNRQEVKPSLISGLRRRFRRGRRGSMNDQETYHSRAVMRRAFAYSLSYFLTWIWSILYAILVLAGVLPIKPMPKWEIGYWYVWNFFLPLQGMWTFLIFLYPKVVGKRRSSGGSISWFKAFRIALWSAVTGKKITVGSTGQTDATSGAGTMKASVTTAGSALRGGSTHGSTHSAPVSLCKGTFDVDGVQVEEEKMKIEEEP